MKKIEKSKLINQIKNLITEEAKAISNLVNYVDNNFYETVKLILECKGRVILTGIGKSAIIAQKICATFNSTGTPAVFMHAADAIHGDLGIIQNDDILMCLSNSGNTPEIKVLIPLIKLRGNKIIAITGNKKSYLAENSDYILLSKIEKEIDEHNLIPTTSSVAQLVVGDALAVALLSCRGFSVEDFAKFHPGGNIGKRIYLKASDLAAKNSRPFVYPDSDINTVICEMTAGRLGAVVVLDQNSKKIKGIITDGDIRRMLQNNKDYSKLIAKDIMTSDPKVISPNTLAADALRIMEKYNITQLIITEKDKYLGIIHLHDILKEGLL